MEVTEEFGWYNRNAAINPFQVEGKRTVGHELAEQTRGDVPDWLVFSMGDGCTIYGGWKGFREFRDLGFVDEAPKMLGVQAEGARAIHDAYHEHDSTDDVANTLADSIAVGRPRNTLKAVKALNESGGTSVVVSDDEILRGRRRSAAPRESTPNPPGRPHRGIRKALSEGIIDEDESVLAVVTGYGLKDAKSAVEASGSATEIEPELDEVKQRYSP